MNVPPRHIRLNEPLRDREANRISGEVFRQAAEHRSLPQQVGEYADEKILARIVAGAVPANGRRLYSWTWLIPQPDGSYVDDPYGTGGNENWFPTFEIEGNCHVPVDGSAVVFLEPIPGESFFVFNFSRRPVWAELGASSGALYAWVEKYPTAAGTWATLSGGLTGTTTQNAAREMYGTENVAAGTIVQLFRGYSAGATQVVIGRTQPGDGSLLRERHSVKVLRAVAGTFTLTYEGQTTGALAWNANAAAVEAALEALSLLTDVTVTGTGTDGDPFIVEYQDDFDPKTILFHDDALLLGSQEWLFSAGTGQGDMVFEGSVTFHNAVVVVSGTTSFTYQTGTTNVYESGSTSTYNTGSVFNLNGTTNYGATFVGVFVSGSTNTYNAGSVLNQNGTINYGATFAGVYVSGSTNTYQSGATNTYNAGSTFNFAGTLNLSGAVNITGGTWIFDVGVSLLFECDLTFEGDAYFGGEKYYFYDAPETLTTSQNNWTFSKTIKFVNPTSPVSITGFVKPADTTTSVIKYLKNYGTERITFPHQSGSSSAGNKFQNPQGQDYYLDPDQTGAWIYDQVNDNWEPLWVPQGQAGGSGSSAVPTWVTVTKTYAELATAGTTNTITLYTLAPKETVHGAILKHSAVWAGGALTTVNMSVLCGGSPSNTNLDVMSAVTGTNFRKSGSGFFEPPYTASFTATDDLQLKADSFGDDLDAATAGSVDVWLLLSTMP